MAWRDLFRWGRKYSTLDLFREIYGAGWSTKSGRAVNLDTAIQVSVVFACARLLGYGMAQVPLKLKRETTAGKHRMRVAAKDHPLYDVIGLRPNPWQTSFEFRQMMSWHVELCGRFIAFKNAPLGTVIELIPFEPETVKITRNADRSLKYEVTAASGSVQEFPEESIWHVRGPSWNGWSAINTLHAAREAIGLSISIEEALSGLHKNGVRSAGVYSVEGKLNEQQFKDLRAWLDAEYGGANAGKPLILDRGAKWQQTQMSSVDAQTNESRMRQVEEVCRFFGVLPTLIGYSDKTATYASAEAMFQAHLMHTLSPRWTAYEQSMAVNLLTKKERAEGLYFDFVEEGMIRGSVKDTKDAILGYVNGGVITANEGRELLDLNPDSDPESDKLRIPVNTVQDPKKPEEPVPA